jgi:hypothetical protein
VVVFLDDAPDKVEGREPEQRVHTQTYQAKTLCLDTRLCIAGILGGLEYYCLLDGERIATCLGLKRTEHTSTFAYRHLDTARNVMVCRAAHDTEAQQDGQTKQPYVRSCNVACPYHETMIHHYAA